MRLALTLRGQVQGVGLRPYVRRSARTHGLTGWVRNDRDAVRIEVQGYEDAVLAFAATLEHDMPAPASVESLEREVRPEQAEDAFAILPSDTLTPVAPLLPPDLATCAACLDEIADPKARRYRYPFTNCARCGPRYSIVERLPYDRSRTSMRHFAMCEACAGEYGDLDDRRHHAQPIACPTCGPTLSLVDRHGFELSRADAALRSACARLLASGIVALRGLGGFQLLVDATNPSAVAELRWRKQRPHKPFAVMFANLAQLEVSAVTSPADRDELASAAAPIVLLRRRDGAPLALEIAPANPWIGAMLPYTPLHRLLLDDVGLPLVCTSGNVSDEPMCLDLDDALARMGSIADVFLTHDRPIVRPLDDSVVRTDSNGVEVLRRARGYAPRRVAVLEGSPGVLALGAHQKNAVALVHDGAVVLSQHIGDLDSLAARELLEATVTDLCAFHDVRPEHLACDLHPDYASTALAERLAAGWNAPLHRVQHHHAHAAGVMAEHGLEGEVLALVWDGTGYGPDGTVWGGEALLCRACDFDRFAHLRTFPLPGGDAAVRQPRRSAFGALHELLPQELSRARAWYRPHESDVMSRASEAGLNAPRCSSVGRLFDAVAALLDLASEVTFEGQAAIALEHLAMTAGSDGTYAVPLAQREGCLVADTAQAVANLLADLDRGVAPAVIARRFHDSLVEMGVAIAERAGRERVVLAGGCFQNRLLLDTLRSRLERSGFGVFSARSVPASDGGLAVGQAWVAAHRTLAPRESSRRS